MKQRLRGLMSLLLVVSMLAPAVCASAAEDADVLSFTAERKGGQLLVTATLRDVTFNVVQVHLSYDTARLTPSDYENNTATDRAGDMTRYHQEAFDPMFTPEGWLSASATLKPEAGGVEYVLSVDPAAAENGLVDETGYVEAGDGLPLFTMSFRVAEGAELYADSIQLSAGSGAPTGLVIATKELDEHQQIMGITDPSAVRIDLSAVAEPGNTPGGITPRPEEPEADKPSGGTDGDGGGQPGGNERPSGDKKPGGDGGSVGQDGPGHVDKPQDGGALTDIAGHWAKADVDALVERGILTGYPDGTFRPENQLTRAEFAIVLTRALDLEPGGAHGFDDVSGYIAPYVAAVSKAGYMAGVGGGAFAPERPITRQEVVTVAARALGLEGGGAPDFTDAGEIAPWARDGVSASVSAGLVMGLPDGRFAPGRSITRGEMARIVTGMLALV